MQNNIHLELMFEKWGWIVLYLYIKRGVHHQLFNKMCMLIIIFVNMHYYIYKFREENQGEPTCVIIGGARGWSLWSIKNYTEINFKIPFLSGTIYFF